MVSGTLSTKTAPHTKPPHPKSGLTIRFFRKLGELGRLGESGFLQRTIAFPSVSAIILGTLSPIKIPLFPLTVLANALASLRASERAYPYSEQRQGYNGSLHRGKR
jgi:hypothetical protein